MKKNALSVMLAVAMVAGTGCFNGVLASGTSSGNAVYASNNNIQNSTRYQDKKTNIFLQGKLSNKIEATEQGILSYVNENKSLFGDASKLKVVSIEKDELGYTKIKLAQIINTIPIDGSEVIIHLDKSGIIKNIVGSINNKYKSIDNYKAQTLTEKDAIKIAKQQFNSAKLEEQPKVKKQFIVKDNTPILVYKVNIYYTQPEIGNWNVMVNAVSGDIVGKTSNIRYDELTKAKSTADKGTGTAVDGSTKELNLSKSGSSYQMIDTTKPMSGQVKTYTANNKKTEPGTIVSNSSNRFNTEVFKASVSAHYYSGVVYDFYKNLFNRNSIDGKGMSIESTTHYGNKYNNAFWDGRQMIYGDGDGSRFTYFSGDLDVVAHELTHGVTTNSADLEYYDQSGALNESFSDVFGVLIQTYDRYNVKNGGSWRFDAKDWVVGDEIYTPNKPGDALRSLADPTLYNQPANMSDYEDGGDVHTNSGIPNKAAFLVAKSIGCEKTARIYYRALTNYLTYNSDFSAARKALISAASDIYGDSSNEIEAINSAFDSVGIR
ncbi:peptidase M4 family protein [Clostridium sp. P21]|uniref:Neutral metalloproteinase n=1 Tax=Clostridium muellerianum TaxID=2716538 RepID=A0A7Y0HQP1_9CLOT|nr:M4 family metallopeptidase [Clostridium muellerianum]NMM64008.1 peptidase M4 family protein [Clostridium muellerianum]